MPTSYKNKIYTTLGTPTNITTTLTPLSVSNSSGVPVKDYTVKGKSIVWNQIVKNGNFVDKTGWSAYNGTGSVSNNKYTFTVTGTQTYSNIKQYMDKSFFIAGHKYYVTATITPQYSTGKVTLALHNGAMIQETLWTATASSGKTKFVSTTFTISSNFVSGATGSIIFMVYCPQTQSAQGYVTEVSNVWMVDLTKMFGAGNEPTAAQFRAMFPDDYYEYDAGTIKSISNGRLEATNATQSYKSVNIPVETYFPDGMRSAGSAYDEINFLSQKAVKRIGVVDMGTLVWAVGGNENTKVFYATISGKKTNNRIVCDRYIRCDNAWWDSMPDKSILSNTTYPIIYVKDSSYTDAAAFKAAMSGSTLYYELETSVETAIVSPLQALPTYKGFTSFSFPNSLMQNGPFDLTYYAEGGANPEKGWLTSYKRKISVSIPDIQNTQKRDNYPIKGQFTTTRGSESLTWDVLDYDKHELVDADTTKTMCVCSHDIISYGTMPFCAPQLMYWSENGLPAGTYKLTLDHAQYEGGTLYDGTYMFTLTKAIPADGGFRHTKPVGGWQSSYEKADILGNYITTYGARPQRSAIESGVTFSEYDGTTECTDLGTFTARSRTYYTEDDTVNGGKRNFTERQAYGSNRWRDSVYRQWLNSTTPAGTTGNGVSNWWTPQSVFDRAPGGANSAGFLYGLDPSFVAAMGKVKVITALCDCDKVDGATQDITYDKVWLQSMTEVFGNANNSISEGVRLAYWNGSTDADRIKYHNGTARYWWLRSPDPTYAYRVRDVHSSGELGDIIAGGAFGVVPACCIKQYDGPILQSRKALTYYTATTQQTDLLVDVPEKAHNVLDYSKFNPLLKDKYIISSTDRFIERTASNNFNNSLFYPVAGNSATLPDVSNLLKFENQTVTFSLESTNSDIFINRYKSDGTVISTVTILKNTQKSFTTTFSEITYIDIKVNSRYPFCIRGLQVIAVNKNYVGLGDATSATILSWGGQSKVINGVLYDGGLVSVKIDGKNLITPERDSFTVTSSVGTAVIASGETMKNIAKNSTTKRNSSYLKVDTANAVFNPSSKNRVGMEATYSVSGEVVYSPMVWITGTSFLSGTHNDVQGYHTIEYVRDYEEASTYNPLRLYVQGLTSGTVTAKDFEIRENKQQYTIPTTVTSLPGYGIGIGDICNSIERQETGWHYVQRASSIRFTTALLETAGETGTTTIDGKTVAWAQNIQFPDSGVSRAFNGADGWANISALGDVVFNGTKYNSTQYRMYFMNYSSIEDVKTALGTDGVMFHYQIATPVITDISDKLADSFLKDISVIPGGKVVMYNNGLLDVPSTVKWKM